jgi:tetratricopeptide (TPR) repeat protein
LAGWGVSPPKTTFPVVRRLAERALELADDLAEAHAVLAFLSMAFDWNWQEAEAGYRRALVLNPGYAHAHFRYAYLLMILGRFDEALQRMQQARELEPLSLIFSNTIGYILYFMGLYDQAIAQHQATLALDDGFPPAHYMMGLAYEQQGKYDRAVEAFQRAMSLGKGALGDMQALGHAYAASGRRDEAREILDELLRLSEHRHVPAFFIGLSYFSLEETESGFAWLERAYEQRDFYLIFLGVDPRLARLHADPRFTDLMRCMRLGA